ncbi:MAG: hypothetical protein COA45_02570 [Zetaproteobacteria bacterium]|nr:MAG: hypothetical protein COA45_02570 [Zetaproteobacteria bacterium]
MNIQRLKNARIYFLLATILFALPSFLSFYQGHAGKILIATEQLSADPNFTQTVIYIFDHSVWGAQGIILNRPRQSPDLKERLFVDQDVTFYKGGPVAFPEMRLVAMNRLNAISHWRTQGLYIVPYKKFKKLFPEDSEKPFDIYLGYSGWKPGQLEKEIRNDMWVVEEYSAEILDNSQRQTLWARLLENHEETMKFEKVNQ